RNRIQSAPQTCQKRCNFAFSNALKHHIRCHIERLCQQRNTLESQSRNANLNDCWIIPKNSYNYSWEYKTYNSQYPKYNFSKLPCKEKSLSDSGIFFCPIVISSYWLIALSNSNHTGCNKHHDSSCNCHSCNGCISIRLCTPV